MEKSISYINRKNTKGNVFIYIYFNSIIIFPVSAVGSYKNAIPVFWSSQAQQHWTLSPLPSFLPHFFVYLFSDPNNTHHHSLIRIYTINTFDSPHSSVWIRRFPFLSKSPIEASRKVSFSGYSCWKQHYWNHYPYDVKNSSFLFILIITLYHVYSLPFLISTHFFFFSLPHPTPHLFMSFWKISP